MFISLIHLFLSPAAVSVLCLALVELEMLDSTIRMNKMMLYCIVFCFILGFLSIKLGNSNSHPCATFH